MLSPAILLAISSCGPPQEAPPARPDPAEWSWDAERVSSAYLALICEFQSQWDTVRASDDGRGEVVERFAPRFQSLVERGDPDAKRWMLDFADWERAAREPDVAARLLAYASDLLGEQGHTWRAGIVAHPLSQAWYFLRAERDQILARVDDYLARARNESACTEIRRQLGQALFECPRGPSDQERVRAWCAVLAEGAQDEAARGWGKRVGEALRGQLLGAPLAEVAGEDVDGNVLRLSDLRGKAVVLVFWGFW
jgi:hypothetical protein